jgi:hypothetical protein
MVSSTRIKVHLVGLLVILMGGPGEAPGADDMFCGQYARQAIAQYEEAKASSCEGLAYPEWSDDYNHHFQWCMRESVSQALADSKRRDRQDFLRRCKGDPPIVPECDEYATTACSQNNLNIMRECGFSDARWSSDYDYHYSWCVHGNNRQHAKDQTLARKMALDADCPTRQGDLVALDWCYRIERPTGMGGPITLNVHPMIMNDSDEAWYSTKEGTYNVGATLWADYHQARLPLRRFPDWSIGAGQTKILPGLTVPFAESNVYYNLGSWLFTHPDDTNPGNNELVNRDLIAVRGQDFLDGGRLSYLRCQPPGEPCSHYARIGVAQSMANLERECDLSGELWSSSYDDLHNRCLVTEDTTTAMAAIERALALQRCGALPQCTPAMEITVRIRKIDVLDEGDGDGNAEPYLFPIFFRIDKIEKNTGSNWFHAPGGSHGNLLTNYGAEWDAGDTIPVPIEIGRWHTSLSRGQADTPERCIFVGVVVILFEEDHFPPSDKVPDIYSWTTSKIIDYLRNAWPLLLARPRSGDFTEIEQYIAAKIKLAPSAMVDDNPVLRSFWEVADTDDLIGVSIFTWSWEELKSDPYQIVSRAWNEGTGSEDGDFTIHADVIARPVCE